MYKILLLAMFLFSLEACHSPSNKGQKVTLVFNEQHFGYQRNKLLDPKLVDVFNGMFDSHDSVIIGQFDTYWVPGNGVYGFILTIHNNASECYLYRLCRVYQKDLYEDDSSHVQIGTKLELQQLKNFATINEIRSVYLEVSNENCAFTDVISGHNTSLEVWIKLCKYTPGNGITIKNLTIRDIDLIDNLERLVSISMRATKYNRAHFFGSYEILL